MSNEVVAIHSEEWTPDQIKLITDVVAKNATPDELKLFLYRCKEMRLNPLKPGQIHFIKYSKDKPGTIVIGIEGFRSIAARTGKLSGIKRGALKDDKGALLGAFAEVHRSDWQHCAREEVPLSEYNTGYGPWKSMPETMIKKVAEAAALRMAFPDDLGGIYSQEEMDQAEKQARRVVPEQPEEGNGTTTSEYCVPYGPQATRPISEWDPVVLRDFILDREAKYKASGRPHGAWFKELLKHAEPIIAEFENGDGAA